MGQKGAKMTRDSVINTELMVNKLTQLGDISAKGMFGGHGIFFKGKMFGMVDSKGVCFLKLKDEKDQLEIEKLGSTKHSRMPYWSIPETVFKELDILLAWANKSILLIST